MVELCMMPQNRVVMIMGGMACHLCWMSSRSIMYLSSFLVVAFKGLVVWDTCSVGGSKNRGGAMMVRYFLIFFH